VSQLVPVGHGVFQFEIFFHGEKYLQIPKNGGRGDEYLSRYCDSLRAKRSGNRTPVEARFLRAHLEQTWCPPGLLKNGYRVLFPGVKRPGRSVITHHHLISRLKKEYSYNSTPSLGLFYTTTYCSLKTYCAILVRRSNFRHLASPRVSPRDSTQRRKVELWARNVRQFCLHVDFPRYI
jgi:hypothetical protein